MAGILNYQNGWQNYNGLLSGFMPIGNFQPDGLAPQPIPNAIASPVVPQPFSRFSPGTAAPTNIDPQYAQAAVGGQPPSLPGNGTPQPPRSDFWRDDNTGNGASNFLGGAVSYDPSKDMGKTNRLGMFGAALADVGAHLSGHPADATNLQSFVKNNKAQLLRQNIAAAGDDPVKMRQAVMDYAINGGDPNEIIAAQNYGKPIVSHYGIDENVFSTNPLTGTQTQLQTGQRKPITSGGMQSTDNGKTWAPIPGYAAQRGATADAIAAGRAAHPMPSRTKAAAPGAINIPHPAGQY